MGNPSSLWLYLRWPIGLVLLTGFIALILTIGLPRADEPRGGRRRPIVLGAATTAVLWVTVTLLLPVYVHLAGGSSQTLGVLGGGLILLLWTYLLMISLFFGALVTRSLHEDPTVS